MNDILLDFWQQITGQVCGCKHTKRHHIKFKNDRSDMQCLDWVFNGGAYGDGGTLGCCQCLSYQKRKLINFRPILIFRSFFIKPKPLPTPRECFCICGHTALDHGIGDPTISLEPLYPPCNVCNCKEYDYVNNPKIAQHNSESVKQ